MGVSKKRRTPLKNLQINRKTIKAKECDNYGKPLLRHAFENEKYIPLGSYAQYPQ